MTKEDKMPRKMDLLAAKLMTDYDTSSSEMRKLCEILWMLDDEETPDNVLNDIAYRLLRIIDHNPKYLASVWMQPYLITAEAYLCSGRLSLVMIKEFSSSSCLKLKQKATALYNDYEKGEM